MAKVIDLIKKEYNKYLEDKNFKEIWQKISESIDEIQNVINEYVIERIKNQEFNIISPFSPVKEYAELKKIQKEFLQLQIELLSKTIEFSVSDVAEGEELQSFLNKINTEINEVIKVK